MLIRHASVPIIVAAVEEEDDVVAAAKEEGEGGIFIRTCPERRKAKH